MTVCLRVSTWKHVPLYINDVRDVLCIKYYALFPFLQYSVDTYVLDFCCHFLAFPVCLSAQAAGLAAFCSLSTIERAPKRSDLLTDHHPNALIRSLSMN